MLFIIPIVLKKEFNKKYSFILKEQKNFFYSLKDELKECSNDFLSLKELKIKSQIIPLKRDFEENKKAILRQLVHLGDIDSIDKLNEIDPLFNYDLFMYSKYPNGLKKKNERKEVERKESNKKDKQVPPETKVNPVKTTKVPENKPPYKNKFISFAKTIFLVPVLLYILSLYYSLFYLFH